MRGRETEKVGIKATMVNHFFLNIFQFLLEGHFSPHQVCVMDFVDVVILIQQWFYQNPSIWACIQPPFSPVFVNLSFPFSIQTSITNITQKLPFQPNSALRSVKAQLGVQKNNGGPEGFAHVNSNSIHLFKSQLPSLKLTWPLKNLWSWKMRFPFGMAFFVLQSKKKNRLPKNRRGFKFWFLFFWGGCTWPRLQ